LLELEEISTYVTSPFLEELWLAYADLCWDSTFSNELKTFGMLLSWQDWGTVVARRLAMEATETIGLRRLVCRVMNRIFRQIAGYLPAEHGTDPQVAAMLRNRFDTSAHTELYKTVLGRAAEGTIGESASWAKELLEKWQAFS
jgi:hypothetical protein